METNNKTILIAGVIILGMVGGICGYEQTLIASISGLVGYLAKDIKIEEPREETGLSTEKSDEDGSE